MLQATLVLSLLVMSTQLPAVTFVEIMRRRRDPLGHHLRLQLTLTKLDLIVNGRSMDKCRTTEGARIHIYLRRMYLLPDIPLDRLL